MKEKLQAGGIEFAGFSTIRLWETLPQDFPGKAAFNRVSAVRRSSIPRILKYIETHDLPMDVTGHPRPDLLRNDQLHFSGAGYRLLAERVRP